MKKIFLFVFTFLSTTCVFGQSLFVPAEIRAAYEQGTRNENGEPGDAYFQNHADYKMEVQFNPATGFLEGDASIDYHNESSDTLEYIVIRLYQNIFKKGINRDFAIGEGDLHQGVELYEISAGNYTWNDRVKDFQVREMGSNLMVELKRPLYPGGKLNLDVSWGVQLPRDLTIRMGQYGRGNWFVGYWYPQIAVYDDIVGWDLNAFTGSAEYYLDFNSYDVKITVPGKYMLWATGDLQNGSDVYTEKILSRIEKARYSDSVITIVGPDDLTARRVLLPKAELTYHFVADTVPDFAFACSDNYLWNATSALVDKDENRRTLVQAVYKQEVAFFDQVASIGKQILEEFSTSIMGVPYPYSKMTAFHGDGGMEFPMMINDADVPTYASTVYLTAHEIGHSYFPFYVGTNEAYYAFMDEGLISFLPRDVERTMLNQQDPMKPVREGFQSSSGRMNQMPLMVRSYAISHYPTYRLHAYTRSASAFSILRDYLGSEAFHRALEKYIRHWAYKHPTPYDFFNIMEQEAGEDLDWYWRSWFFGLNYPDVAIQHADDELVITNPGGLPLPVELVITAGDKEHTLSFDASVWQEQQEIRIPLSRYSTFQSAHLIVDEIPDADAANNQVQSE